VYDILPLCCRKKSKKRKSGEVQLVFGVDSKDMRHGKILHMHGINANSAGTNQEFMTMILYIHTIWSWGNFKD